MHIYVYRFWGSMKNHHKFHELQGTILCHLHVANVRYQTSKFRVEFGSKIGPPQNLFLVCPFGVEFGSMIGPPQNHLLVCPCGVEFGSKKGPTQDPFLVCP